MIAKSDSWLTLAQHCPSPNFDDRPEASTVDLLVIHNISLPPGQFGGPWIKDLFLNQLNPSQHAYFQEIGDLKVSAHFLIDRGGEILQFVPMNKRAWHAGVSDFQGRECCNDFSIGIELEGVDDLPYTEPQYQSLAKLTTEIQRQFPSITKERITGHQNIAPQRKTDPGPAFDWHYYFSLLDG